MLGGKQAYVIVCLDSGVQHPREAILEKSKLFLISVMGAKARKDKKKTARKKSAENFLLLSSLAVKTRVRNNVRRDAGDVGQWATDFRIDSSLSFKERHGTQHLMQK